VNTGLQPNSAAMTTNFRIETVTTLAGTLDAIAVFRSAWGNRSTIDVDTYFAAAAHGAYLGVGYVNDEPVTASFGFLSVDPVTGGPGLHSHMAATRRDMVSRGAGFAIKTHQRLWAQERGIAAITWTFDPLQRRNAWFNLARLGATVIGFHENLYGALGDAINGEAESDRFEVRLEVTVESGAPVVPRDGDIVIAIPESIDELRLSDTEAARSVQASLRNAMHALRDGSVCVRGISNERSYVLGPKP
jgi:predicted GNAT superfamily acetyltransferase